MPGLICSIVSFIFKAAGQAISFLVEHTWLIIFAVVLFYGKVSQAQPVTLPNKRTCQKNCSHNEQRLVYVVTCGRWRGYGAGGRVGRRLSRPCDLIAALWIGFEGWADWWVKTKRLLSMRRRPTVVSLCLHHWLTRASCSVLPA